MIVLSGTTDELRIVLAAAVTTNQLHCVASWRDITTLPTYIAGRTLTYSNGTTEAIVVDGPAASTMRVVDFLSVYNADTVSATVTVLFDDGTNSYNIYKGTIAAGARIEYENGKGFT